MRSPFGPVPGGMPVELRHERLLHAEHGIGIEVLTPGDEQVGRHRQVPSRRDDHVYVAGAIRMAPHLAQHASHRPIGRHRIERRSDRTKPVAPVGVGSDPAARLHSRLPGNLHVIAAFAVARPDVEQRILERPAIRAEHPSGIERRLALHSFGKIAAARQFGSALPIEGAQHRRFDAALIRGMVEGDDEHRHTQRVRQQDELLALVRAGLADVGEKLYGREPFGFGQLHLPNEIVKMRDQRSHDALEPWVVTLGEARDHSLGNALLIELAHRFTGRYCSRCDRPPSSA